MEILYYHQHFSTPDGSTGTRSYEMAKALVSRGHEVTMVCGSSAIGQTGLSDPFVSGKREGVVDGIRVIELELPYSNKDGFLQRAWIFLKFAARGVREALSQDYDLLFATTTPLTAGIPGIFAKLLKGKPFVFEVRDLWPELPREMGVIKNPVVLWAMGILEWVSYHAADRCIGLSPGIVEGIARRGIPKEKIRMIPNGCDLELFDPGNVSARRPEELRDSDFCAIFTGAHGIANGLDAVLNAAAVLKARGRDDLRLVFIGDGKLKPALVERAKVERLDNCIFLPPVSKKELTALMQGCDVGLMILANVPAFYYGTSPNKFFDYIASGMPVLNNYPGWLAGLIAENGCGIAVPPDDPEAFADALILMADDKDRLREMGRNSRALAESQFDRGNLTNDCCDWLEESVR